MIERSRTDPQFGLQFMAAADDGTFNPDFSAAFDPASNPLSIEQQTVAGERTTFNPLVFFGASQAVFFMMFTAMGSAIALLEERRDGPGQRLLVSPTPRIVLLAGKFAGTVVNCAVQVALLLLALTVVGSLLAGEVQFIWGNNLLLLALVVLLVALAAAGVGTVVAALAKTPEQGNIVGGVISLAFGVLGGAFFSVEGVPIVRDLRYLTLNYWGVNAFTKLALDQTDVLLNLAVLALMGVILFAVGTTLYSRRLSA
jgi:ABC-type multidrug transport system permease subunit